MRAAAVAGGLRRGAGGPRNGERRADHPQQARRSRLLRRRHPLGDDQHGHRPGAPPARRLRPRRLHVDGLGRRLPGLEHQHRDAPAAGGGRRRARGQGRVPLSLPRARRGRGGTGDRHRQRRRVALPDLGEEPLQLPGHRRFSRLRPHLRGAATRHPGELPGAAADPAGGGGRSGLVARRQAGQMGGGRPEPRRRRACRRRSGGGGDRGRGAGGPLLPAGRPGRRGRPPAGRYEGGGGRAARRAGTKGERFLQGDPGPGRALRPDRSGLSDVRPRLQGVQARGARRDRQRELGGPARAARDGLRRLPGRGLRRRRRRGPAVADPLVPQLRAQRWAARPGRRRGQRRRPRRAGGLRQGAVAARRPAPEAGLAAGRTARPDHPAGDHPLRHRGPDLPGRGDRDRRAGGRHPHPALPGVSAQADRLRRTAPGLRPGAAAARDPGAHLGGRPVRHAGRREVEAALTGAQHRQRGRRPRRRLRRLPRPVGRLPAAGAALRADGSRRHPARPPRPRHGGGGGVLLLGGGGRQPDLGQRLLPRPAGQRLPRRPAQERSRGERDLRRA